MRWNNIREKILFGFFRTISYKGDKNGTQCDKAKTEQNGTNNVTKCTVLTYNVVTVSL